MAKTQADIAKKLNISQMSVSRALNNKPGVGQELRKKILRVIKKEGFQTNRLASSLATGRTKLIGLLVPSVTYSFFPEITDSIERICGRHGYHTILCHTGENYERTAAEIRLLMGMRVSGLIIVPPFGSGKTGIYAELKKKIIPFIFLDRYLPGVKSSYVVSDGKKGSRTIADYLISIGHRKIAFIKGPETASSANEVYVGYREAMLENGLRPRSVPGGFNEEEGYRAAKEIISRKMNPTAIMAVNDPVAIGALEAVTALNMKVPDEISLTGFSDIKMTAKLFVPLTTAKENTRDMGEKAAEILFRMIEKRKEIVEKIKLEPELVIRKSTRPVEEEIPWRN